MKPYHLVAFIVSAKHMYIKLKLVLLSKRMLGRTMIKQLQNKSNTKGLTKTGRPVTPNRTIGVVTQQVVFTRMCSSAEKSDITVYSRSRFSLTVSLLLPYHHRKRIQKPFRIQHAELETV